jgi:hypothetical protein
MTRGTGMTTPTMTTTSRIFRAQLCDRSEEKLISTLAKLAASPGRYSVPADGDARAFSDRNESFGIPKMARVRFKLHAGEGGQHAWPRRFPLIFAKG